MAIARNIIVIGSSTGGPRVLDKIFRDLPNLDASIVIVQHMAEYTNCSFSKRLNRYSDVGVKVAEHGDVLEPGMAYLAPSGRHLGLVDNESIRLFDGPRVNYVKPAVDITMQSLKDKGDRLVAVVLTGFGSDGARGSAYVKKLGGTVIAQDKESSVVYGMPKAASATGCVDMVLSPEGIRGKLIELMNIKERVNARAHAPCP